MKNHEEETSRTLSSLDGLNAAPVPSGYEERFFDRLDRELEPLVHTPKWFWVAATVLLLLNAAIGWNYALKPAAEAQAATENYFFPGGTSWF